MRATRKYIETITTALSNDNKITFKEGNGWSTDIKKREVIYNPLDLINYDIDGVKGLLIHETGHINFTTDNTTTKLQKEKPRIQLLYNVLEDIRIEKKMIDKYGDFAKYPLSTINTIGLNQKSDKPEELLKEPKLLQYLHGLQAFILPKIYQMKDSGIITDNIIRKGIEPEVLEKLRATFNNKSQYDLLDDIQIIADDTKDIKELAENYLYPYCKEYLDEMPPQEKEPHIQEKIRTIKGGLKEGKAFYNRNIPSETELDSLLNPYASTMARRLTDILKEKRATKFNGQFKSGKLLSKNAYKVLTNSTRIFSKKNKIDQPDYTITMILDESGSMLDGEKHKQTFIASHLIEQTCKKMKFKINLVGMDSEPRLLNSMQDYREIRGGGNNEIKAFDKVKENLNSQDDNLIFMLTDGLACTKPRDEIRTLTDKYNAKVIAIGIGLNENEKDRMHERYPDYAIAEKPENLSTIMIDTIKRIITR